MSKNERNIMSLRDAARKHEAEGNTILAKWMTESANYLKAIQFETDNFLDGFLCREESTYTTRREEFRSQWYELEDEYIDNFSMC